MLVPDEIRKCVAFIGQKNHATSGYVLRGTAFLIGLSMDKAASAIYLVTAKHVIKKIKNTGSTEVSIRFNTKTEGAQWYSFNINAFFFPEDPTIDIAVTNFKFSENLDHLVLPITMTLTPEIINKENIGVGDEVFITGLFKNHYGKSNNIPIVRVGNISAMLGEKVDTEMGLMDAYLIESRSIGGLSGSPAFVNLGLHRFIDGKVKEATVQHIQYFLGIIHGHFDEINSEIDVTDSDEEQSKKINMGMAIVVPATEIKKLIDREDVKAQREASYKKLLDSRKPTNE